MRPLILEFKEKPKNIDVDYSIIEYSENLNLSTIKGSNKPAISAVNMATETFTKTGGEPSDSDNNYTFGLRKLLDTRTDTFTSTEESDSDNNFNSLQKLLSTQTVTESVEPTDSDR